MGRQREGDTSEARVLAEGEHYQYDWGKPLQSTGTGGDLRKACPWRFESFCLRFQTFISVIFLCSHRWSANTCSAQCSCCTCLQLKIPRNFVAFHGLPLHDPDHNEARTSVEENKCQAAFKNLEQMSKAASREELKVVKGWTRHVTVVDLSLLSGEVGGRGAGHRARPASLSAGAHTDFAATGTSRLAGICALLLGLAFCHRSLVFPFRRLNSKIVLSRS